MEEEKPKPKFLVSSGFENNHYSINSNNIDQMSLEPLKLNAITQPTQQDEVEDSIFSRFYALTDHNARPNSIKKITDPKAKPNSIQKKEEFSPKKRNSSPTKPPGCFSKLFCCFKKTPESEEDYYSQL